MGRMRQGQQRQYSIVRTVLRYRVVVDSYCTSSCLLTYGIGPPNPAQTSTLLRVVLSPNLLARRMSTSIVRLQMVPYCSVLVLVQYNHFEKNEKKREKVISGLLSKRKRTKEANRIRFASSIYKAPWKARRAFYSIRRISHGLARQLSTCEIGERARLSGLLHTSGVNRGG